MKARVRTYKKFIHALHLLEPKYRKVLLQACCTKKINCICECIYNILKGNIPLKSEVLKKLTKYKTILRKLVKRGKNISRKHILIQKGGAFLPIILSSVLSSILKSFTS